MPIPLLGAIQAGAGLAQSIIGGIKARKYQKQLEGMQSPTYSANKSILDYYNTALQRYNVSPTDSALYKRNMQNVGRNLATGLSSLQNRNSALAGTSSLLRAANDAALNTEVQAENQRNQRFSQLGGATQMKAGEDRMAYQQNELAPFERKYNLLAARAGAANATTNTGLSNIFGGLQTAANMQMINKMYGDGNENPITQNTNSNFGLNQPTKLGRGMRKYAQLQFGYQG